MVESKILGTPIARIAASTGAGGDLSKIIDGIKPPLDSADPLVQWDSYNDGLFAAEDYVGLMFSQVYSIRRIVFQAGIEFADGGWFDSVEPQIRVNEVWKRPSSIVIIPAYIVPSGHNFNEYEFSFIPTQGDGVRLFGVPGGSAFFVSCGEFEAWGVPYTVPMSPGVSMQEPPYSGPYDPRYYKNPPFATQDNPRNDEVRWCMVCNRPVVVDDRPGFRHRHFRDEDSVEVGE